MMILGPVLGGGAALIGIYFSWSLDLPAGGTVVLVSTVMFFLTWVFAPKHGALRRLVGQCLQANHTADYHG